VVAPKQILTPQGQAQGAAGQQKKIDYALGPKILKKDFNSSELRIWICQMRYFWNAQAMDNRDEDTQWGNFWHCLDHSLCSLYKPKILRGVGVSIFED
jgi:hypothetical protein